MALTNSNADTVATAYCAEIGVTDPDAIDKWKKFMRMMYLGSPGSLLTAITATVPAMSIATTGSATNQTGPAAPVPTVIS